MADGLSRNFKDDPRILELLHELQDRRDTLVGYISDVEKLKDSVSLLFPTKLDARNKFVIDKKLETTSSFYSTLLNLIQEVNKTTTQEIEIRRKIALGISGEEEDIRTIVGRLEAEGLTVESKVLKSKSDEQIIDKPTDEVVEVLPETPSDEAIEESTDNKQETKQDG